MTTGRIARVANAVLWLVVAAYALVVARHFFHFSGTAIQLSTDDGLANIAYALATHGRYGFLSSPVLEDLARDRGLFSYGPFYFYVAAALVWLFGYSLTLVRAIHLAVIVAIAAAARGWYGRVAGGAAGAITAVGVLEAFDRAQWPMVRPDSMVALFAVVLVVSAGLAIRTRLSRYWWCAGAAAGAGALTHLVAWSLVPAVAVLLIVALAADAIASDRVWRWPGIPWRAALSAAAGGLTAAFLFYASFGFRFRDQLAFLAGYQKLTGSLAAMPAQRASIAALIHKHYDLAYWYLPYPLGKLVPLTMAAGVVVTAWALSRPNRAALAWIAPPVVTWILYLASLGVYNNFHSGYAILTQVLWLWTLGALGQVVVTSLDGWPALRATTQTLAWCAAMVLAVGVLTVFAQRTEYRSLAAASLTPIDEYVGRVLGPIPMRARSWGSVDFGIENPDRIQLIQLDDAIGIANLLSPQERATFAPDYLVWSFDENRSNTLHAVNGSTPLTHTITQLAPGRQYALLGMTAGSPYGVTRVYGAAAGAPRLDRPIVDAYDGNTRQWNSALGSPIALAIDPAPPARLQVGQDPPRTAGQTVTAVLPAGTYLMSVAMSAEASGSDAAAVFASVSADVRDPFGTYGPAFDVAPWFSGETAVHLLYQHPGGPVFVSEFGSPRPVIASVQASPVLAFTDYRVFRRAAPPVHAVPASAWVAAYPHITVTPAGGDRADVAGDRTQFGYQAYGPHIAVEPGDRVVMRHPITVTNGTACVGVLDEAGRKWVVVPEGLKPEYAFTIGDSRTIRAVLADCSASPETSAPVRAVIGNGSYEIWSDREDWYVDLLMKARADALAKPR